MDSFRFWIRRNFHGIVEPIQVPIKGSRYGLGYVHTDNAAKMKKTGDQALALPIPHMYHSFPVKEYADRDGPREGILGLFEDIDAIIEDEIELAGIRYAEPGE